MDEQALSELAIHYAARFATSRAKLTDYLSRKVRERGWAGSGNPDLGGLADKLAEQGFVDDRSYAENKTTSLLRRGFGERRVRQALDNAGIGEDDRTGAMENAADGALEAALRYARRRRIGPFAERRLDPVEREKALAAMIRAGHSFALARRVISAAPGQALEPE